MIRCLAYKLITDGQREYTISGDNEVHEGGVESVETYDRTFTLDEVVAEAGSDTASENEVE